ncbi:hypothetical protein CRG98_035336 [Punica granatum]|uniref:Uncharacterized protein n=1 Tax=Punica granatum TaxID=22663 RepID=A0A2I0IJV5_PUNGR|nr:hypothetical protein CRG98_035336 [Punica granatum]
MEGYNLPIITLFLSIYTLLLCPRSASPVTSLSAAFLPLYTPPLPGTEPATNSFLVSSPSLTDRTLLSSNGLGSGFFFERKKGKGRNRKLELPKTRQRTILSARVPNSLPQLQISHPACLPARTSQLSLQLAPLPQLGDRTTRDSGDRLPPAQGTRQE